MMKFAMFGWYQGLSLRWKLTLPLLLLVALVMYMGIHAITTSKILGGSVATIAKVNLPEIQLLIQADRDLFIVRTCGLTLTWFNIYIGSCVVNFTCFNANAELIEPILGK